MEEKSMESRTVKILSCTNLEAYHSHFYTTYLCLELGGFKDSCNHIHGC